MTIPAAASTDPAAEVGHAHVADLETCIDLINTVELTDGIPADHIASPDAAIAWFVDRSLVHEDQLRDQVRAAGGPDAWLPRMQTVRAAMREVWDATVEGRSAAPDAVATLNDVLAYAPHTRLAAGPGGIVVGHRHEAADPTAEALARVTEPLVAAIAGGETGRLRICANDGCRWVFNDTSRGGQRRWCDTREANRAKVRRFRSRRREMGEPDGAASDAPEAGQGRYPRSSSGLTSVAKRTIDSSS